MHSPHAIFRNISFELQRRKMVDVLKVNRPECFLPFLLHATLEKKGRQILETLDQGWYMQEEEGEEVEEGFLYLTHFLLCSYLLCLCVSLP